jgi:hypothetical protein
MYLTNAGMYPFDSDVIGHMFLALHKLASGLPLILQLAWCVLGITLGLFSWYAGHLNGAIKFLIGSVVYGALSIAAFQGKRWAWWLSLVPPLYFVVCTGPWVAYNFYEFFTDHPRYLNSPGTIFIVVINLLMLLLPAVLILILMVACRKRPGSTVERDGP